MERRRGGFKALCRAETRRKDVHVRLMQGHEKAQLGTPIFRFAPSLCQAVGRRDLRFHRELDPAPQPLPEGVRVPDTDG